MKQLAIVFTVALVALFCCQCSTSQYAQAKKGAKSTPYTVLENYFVRNTVKPTKRYRIVLDNEKDFDAIFGHASLMGRLPTDINWKKQYVVAIMLPETNRSTMVTPLDVKQSPGNVIFYYQVNTGHKTSYTIVPFAAVALERTIEPQELQVFFIEK